MRREDSAVHHLVDQVAMAAMRNRGSAVSTVLTSKF
jgi:hypothetical protein